MVTQEQISKGMILIMIMHLLLDYYRWNVMMFSVLNQKYKRMGLIIVGLTYGAVNDKRLNIMLLLNIISAYCVLLAGQSRWNEDEDVDSSKNFWMDHPREDCSITVGSFLDPCKIEHGNMKLPPKKSPGFGKSERTQLWEALDNLAKGFESMNLTETSLQHEIPVCSDVGQSFIIGHLLM